MNKSELVEAVAKATDLSKAKAEDAVNGVFDSITSELKKGNAVQLIGFGSFSVTKRAARKGKNPRTGEAIKIPARKVPKFSAGKGLKDTVAGTKKAAAKKPAAKKGAAKKTAKRK